MNRDQLEELAAQVIDSAFSVHCQLGPGLLESAYEMAFCHELTLRKVSFERQKLVPIQYKDVFLDCGYRIDLLIERSIVAELKAVESLIPLHEAQLFTYLKLTDCQLGFLFNFNVRLFKHGIKRIVRNLAELKPAGQLC